MEIFKYEIDSNYTSFQHTIFDSEVHQLSEGMVVLRALAAFVGLTVDFTVYISYSTPPSWLSVIILCNSTFAENQNWQIVPICIGTRRSYLIKKSTHKKSCDTVPLRFGFWILSTLSSFYKDKDWLPRWFKSRIFFTKKYISIARNSSFFWKITYFVNNWATALHLLIWG